MLPTSHLVLLVFVECCIPDEQKLMATLLENYEPASRPVFNASRVVLVKFGMTLIQVSDMVSHRPGK